jgi:hypothetical protein
MTAIHPLEITEILSESGEIFKEGPQARAPGGLGCRTAQNFYRQNQNSAHLSPADVEVMFAGRSLKEEESFQSRMSDQILRFLCHFRSLIKRGSPDVLLRMAVKSNSTSTHQ